MAYFEDLSVYSYHNSFFYRPDTRNVGWLAKGQDFPKLAFRFARIDGEGRRVELYIPIHLDED